MAINTINNNSGELTINPGASGDSFIQFDINGTGEFRIGVDDTDDSFRISQGSALGTNDTFVMSSAGECTMPLQPAFLAYNSTDDTNVTGDATLYQCEFDTEIFDQNDDYDNTTDTFIAPITGRYLLYAQVGVLGIVSDHGGGYLRINTSNMDYLVNACDPYATMYQTAGDQLAMKYFCLVDMDASDTAIVNLSIDGTSKVADVDGAATVATRFCGYLAV